MKKMNIGGATVNQTPLDWRGNIKNIQSAIESAKNQGVEILCLPELCIPAYGCQDLFLGPWVSEKSLSLLSEIIDCTNSIFVAVGLPVFFENKVYNCMAAIYDQKLLGITAKQFLAIDGIHYESRWFEPWLSGREEEIVTPLKGFKKVPFGDITYEHKGIKIGFEICEDAWRGGVRPGYQLCKRGVDLIMNPSASHFALGKSFDRIALMEESSRTFDCVYIYANLTGNESGRIIYEGDIFIAQKGKIISKNVPFSYQNYGLHFTEIDFDGSEPHPDGSLKRYQEQYDRKEEFTNAVTHGLFDYLRKSYSNGFVLSLSGGADSSCCAILVSEMIRRGVKQLGTAEFLKKINKPEWIDQALKLSETDVAKFLCSKLLYTAYQGTINSSTDTLNSAQKLASEIGAQFYHWTIDDEVGSYTKKINDALNITLNWKEHDITLQNIQSRARSPIIWMIANLKNCLLLTTSNRSEGDTGYTTMDGDSSGSLAPIAGIDKTFIREWLKYAQDEYGYQSLSYVNNLTPTAELRPLGDSQTDEDDLMPYPILLAIEREAIEFHQDPVSVFLKLKDKLEIDDQVLKNYIIKFFRLWSRNQWKRERLAPSFHLDTFNVDPKTWCRFPIISGGFNEEIEALQKL